MADGDVQRGFRADFIVHAPTRHDASVFVAGNCAELGNWNPDHAFLLNKVLDGDVIIPYHIPRMGNAWKGSLNIRSLSSPSDLRYYYFIGTRSIDTHAVSVVKLEGHHSPRHYKPQTGDVEVDEPDLFAVIDEQPVGISGYLTDRTTIILTFDPASIKWHGQIKHNRQFRIRFEHAEPVRYNNSRRPEFKVARFFREGNTHEFQAQSIHGPLIDSQPLVYKCSMNVNETCHVRIDFFELKKHKNKEIPPSYFAYALMAGSLLKGSHGMLTVPIRMPARHQVLRVTDCGQLTIQYTVILSFPLVQAPSSRKSIFRPPALNFKSESPVLHIGHRGCGSSYHAHGSPNPDVCENSIAAFNKAALAGADFVEFDVMLDVDLQPIIYHDHTVLARGKDGTLTELAVKDLSQELMAGDRVFHVSETDGCHRFPKNGHEAGFPSLMNVFKYVEPSVGFNVEVKYPMRMINGLSELNPTASSSFREKYKELRMAFWNKNVFVDAILHVVFGCAGNRPVMFSSFDLDICTMLRLKQVQYPVFLLTCNDEVKGLLYEDVRINYLKRAVYSAAAFELDGVVVPGEVVFQHSWFIPLTKKFKLSVIVYGESNNSFKSIQDLKATGAVKGIIYDRIYEFIAETKEDYSPRTVIPCEPSPPLNCRNYVVGYTGYVPGRLGYVGTESSLAGNAQNSENVKCRNICRPFR